MSNTKAVRSALYQLMADSDDLSDCKIHPNHFVTIDSDELPAILTILTDGNYNDEDDCKEAAQVIDNVVFTILSERGLGPHLYGVFAEGRLEEFIPGAKSLSLANLRDPKLSGIVARKMAKMHALTAPINKEPKWLKSNLNKFASKVALIDPQRIPERDRELARKIVGLDLKKEIDWVL